MIESKQAEVLNQIPNLLDRSVAQWQNCSTDFPPNLPTFSSHEKIQNQARLEAFVKKLQKSNKGIWRRHRVRNLYHDFGNFTGTTLGFKKSWLDIILSDHMKKANADFVRQARQFDAELPDEDILQASRNAWVMHGLQFLFGDKIGVTPSVLAYSLLYPFTDNFLDDASLDLAEKKHFISRFGQRLTGEFVEPANRHEAQIFRLVEMIESEFNRWESPHVFESLLAIHHAQCKSLWLLHNNRQLNESQITHLVFEKGGTSVLADGYLVAGDLSPNQQQFVFDFGVYLQLIDDVQDISEDRKAGLQTIFNRHTKKEHLDVLTNRVFAFGSKLLNEYRSEKNSLPLKHFIDLMQHSTFLLLIEAVGLSPEFYTQSHLDKMEIHSPFYFEFIQKCRNRCLVERISFRHIFTAMEAGQ